MIEASCLLFHHMAPRDEMDRDFSIFRYGHDFKPHMLSTFCGRIVPSFEIFNDFAVAYFVSSITYRHPMSLLKVKHVRSM